MLGPRLNFLFFLLSVCLLSSPSEGQDNVSTEDAQEVLNALADADMVQEMVAPWPDQKKQEHPLASWQGQWDARVALSGKNRADGLTRLNLQTSLISVRGRWRRNRDGVSMQAFTAKLASGPWHIQVGGLGMSTGYGLLLSTPGRSGGLAAAQALPSQVTRVKGWATAAEKRSALGLGLSWHGRGWHFTGMHGRLGQAQEAARLSALCVEKQLGDLRMGGGVVQMDHQQGFTLSGKWQRGNHRLGFEWVLWGSEGQKPRQGVWLISLKTSLAWGLKMQAQWAASNGSAGPAMGVRPSVLNAWGGAGWAVRVTSRSVKSWRVKILLAESRGRDWDGMHQSQAKQFVDLQILGRPWPGYQLSVRWHQRIRTWEAWSEVYPWLPPALVKEDERLGLTLDMKFGGPGPSWAFSLRSLGRQGAATNGRRTLISVRHRRKLGRKISLMASFQSAWGANVDLVTAVNPMRGVLLPRHWGHWSSEIMAGMEVPFWGTRLMGAFSRREPAAGEIRPPENAFWAGARTSW